MRATEIRKAFLEFFRSKDHHILPSYSLVPVNDDTLLWINCGMAPLKDYYSKKAVPPSPRMANCQKSLRTNDIEVVGKTSRHHTMFEMLGNFSIGDYFKDESITWAWEFLVDVLNIDAQRLYVTIHPDDDEAHQIWVEKVGLDSQRVKRDPDNFWEIGPGPCGPNSEIFYDRGPAYSCNEPTCDVGCDCDRYMEVWNLVFTQFNLERDGSLTTLPYKNIDTGMSLERLASILQGTPSNYETDLFSPILAALEKLSNITYNATPDGTIAYRVIADHLRAATFAIADGAMPSNEGRGYVIRRLLRRAIRYARQLGINEPFMHHMVPLVVEVMKDEYTYLTAKQSMIENVILVEEKRFLAALDEGMEMLEALIHGLKQNQKDTIRGPEAFKLYDTFGFPLDLTLELAQEQGVKVDTQGFAQAMAQQRDRARQARAQSAGNEMESNLYDEIEGGDIFVGYQQGEAMAQVLALSHDNELINAATSGQQVGVVLGQTPFYPESGGQVADRGLIISDTGTMEVKEVYRLGSGKIVHLATVTQGTITLGDRVKATIDMVRRQEVARHHTVTHLLHQTLRRVLGEHVNQAGSLVEEDRLRFDFSHFGPLSEEEILEIETQVNEAILAALPISDFETSLSEAEEKGAIALFGERYTTHVRVVEIEGVSLELCGGTHLDNSGEAGLFLILSESGIGSGIRRIEAVTGHAAYQYVTTLRKRFDTIADFLKAKPHQVEARISTLLENNKDLQRQNEQLQSKLAASSASVATQQVTDVDGVKVLALKVEAPDMDALRNSGDIYKDKLGDAVIVLGAIYDDKVGLIAIVSDTLVKERGLHAGNIIRHLAQLCGGGGGGRPNMAQAGGKNPAALPKALAQVPQLVAQQMQRN